MWRASGRTSRTPLVTTSSAKLSACIRPVSSNRPRLRYSSASVASASHVNHMVCLPRPSSGVQVPRMISVNPNSRTGISLLPLSRTLWNRFGGRQSTDAALRRAAERPPSGPGHRRRLLWKLRDAAEPGKVPDDQRNRVAVCRVLVPEAALLAEVAHDECGLGEPEDRQPRKQVVLDLPVQPEKQEIEDGAGHRPVRRADVAGYRKLMSKKWQRVTGFEVVHGDVIDGDDDAEIDASDGALREVHGRCGDRA